MSLPAPISITDQANMIGQYLDEWAQPLGGSAQIAANMRHLWENILDHAKKEERAPLIIICFNGEKSRGAFAQANTMHRVDRDWCVVVMRGHGFKNKIAKSDDTSDDFYTACETIRDRCRVLMSISEEFPVDYKAMRPLPGIAVPGAANVFIDAYEISFSTANDLYAVVNEAPGQD